MQGYISYSSPDTESQYNLQLLFQKNLQVRKSFLDLRFSSDNNIHHLSPTEMPEITESS